MKDDIDDGIGSIVWKLALFLLVSWVCVYVSIVKGIKTSGKLSYIFAIVPYIILVALLSFALTLEGSWNGIKYFINPGDAYMKLFTPKIWYSACTQCFFSLTIGMGCIIMFSSYNKFNHNIYR
jgi:solute carrier family 6 amino acid transporter-like protein 5/7/9/14